MRTMRAAAGIFAGGDMIGGARTMTAAVGHGKKAARNIDAFLRGAVYQKPAPHPPVPYEQLNLAVFLDAERRQQAELPVAQRTGFDEIVSGLSEREARYEADAVPLLRQLFRVRQLLRRLPRAGHREAGQGPVLPGRARSLHRLLRLLRTVSVPCHRDDARARASDARSATDTSPRVSRSGRRRLCMSVKSVVMDGNTAAAHIAYRVNEVFAIFPITPSSTMAELADAWAAQGVKNIWGQIPVIQQMQSEGGAAGAVHGALQSGALTTTFTASQGLLLMLPNMYKIAGELTPCVFYVAARALATQALSIFGDHSDVMSARMTGFAMLTAASVQEAHDLALVAQAATLEARVPVMFFFDGFRTSHEENKIAVIPDDQIRAAIDDDLVRAHRARAPDARASRDQRHGAQSGHVLPGSRGGSTRITPACRTSSSARWTTSARITGRPYQLFRYSGHPEADRVVVVIGSAFEVLDETAAWLNAQRREGGRAAGALYRPWDAERFLAALPSTVKKHCGPRPHEGDWRATATRSTWTSSRRLPRRSRPATCKSMPTIVGGRYGLSSKDFDPAMAKAVFDELKQPRPKHGFTVGINDDVSHTSLTVDANFDIEPPEVVRALFFGLGADGTVGANKNSTKILAADRRPVCAGLLRLRLEEVRVVHDLAPALRTAAHPRAVPPQVGELRRRPQVRLSLQARHARAPRRAAPPFSSTARIPQTRSGTSCRRMCSSRSSTSKLKVYVIDASKVASDLGLGSRVNTILQTCFFALSGVMPRDEAIEAIKRETERTYARKGKAIVKKNFAAIDSALANLHEVPVPAKADGRRQSGRRSSPTWRRRSCATSRPSCWRCAATRCR